MPNSERLQWPYPSDQDNPWFEKFVSLVQAQDASAFASREDRNVLIGGDGTMFFNAGTNQLVSSDTLDIFSPVSGFKLSLDAFTITLNEGELFYVILTRLPSGSQELTINVAARVPNTDDAMVIGIRSGNDVYFRNGVRISSGESKNIFTIGASAASDTYERIATFGVPEGTSTQEATLGRIMYAGSMLGLSVELTRPVTAGTVTINAQIGGITRLSCVLNTVTTTATQTLVAAGTHLLMASDELTVEVVTSGYTNTDTLDGGLTVVVALSAGISVEPANVYNASATVKGVTKLSVAPAVASDPIAVGTNDTRLGWKCFRYTCSGSEGLDFSVTIPGAARANDLYSVFASRADDGVAYVISCPDSSGSDRTTTAFRVVTSSAPSAGHLIDFYLADRN